MLDMAILGLLKDRDLHGYEIRRQLRDNLGILANVSFGSIYPALTRLEKSGAVAATTEGSTNDRAGTPETVPNTPPTGSLSGELAVLRARRHAPSRGRRGKKVYRITEAGRLLFAELLAEGGTVVSWTFGRCHHSTRLLQPGQGRVDRPERDVGQNAQVVAQLPPDLVPVQVPIFE